MALLSSACAADDARVGDPTSAFTYSCVDLGCEFEVLQSPGSSVEPAAWQWSFGDGASSTSQNPSYVYEQAGTYEVAVTVTQNGESTFHAERLSITGSEPSDPDRPVTELGFGARRGGRYVTNWDHVEPGFGVTIEDGWWIADTLTTVSLGPLTERGIQTCDPLMRIVELQGIYDPTDRSMVPVVDLAASLQQDPRINATAVSRTDVGGYPGLRIDGELNLDRVDLAWRFCGRGMRMYALGALNIDDPAYRWIWLPSLPSLSLWIVHVEAADVLIAAAYQNSEEPSRGEIEKVVASLEFHPRRDPEPTRTLRTEFGDVEIRSGSVRLHALVEWAVGRFGQSGLGSPDVARVTFSADVACHEQGYAGGFTEGREAGSHVYLCFGEEHGDPFARPIILHEFGHGWLAAHLDEATRVEFLASLELASWLPAETEPFRAGVEYAADVIVWGLSGESQRPARLAEVPCGKLAGLFRLLTGVEPLTDPASCDA